MNKTWFEENIEKPIQPLVTLLRDNGFNTESSCGHEMYVQCSYFQDSELKRLDDLLFNSGYENYTIEVSIKRLHGHAYTYLQINLGKDKSCLSG